MCRSSWRAQEIGSATPGLISPLVKQLAPDCQFPAQCRWALASQHPLDDAVFKLPTENSRGLPHVTILLWMENVTRFRVSLLGSTPGYEKANSQRERSRGSVCDSTQHGR